jgi:hypothetical protein
MRLWRNGSRRREGVEGGEEGYMCVLSNEVEVCKLWLGKMTLLLCIETNG